MGSSLKALVASLVTALVLMVVWAVPSAQAATYGSWCLAQHNFAVLGASSEVGIGKTGYTGKGADGISGTADDGFYEVTPYGWTTRLRNSLHAEWGTEMQNYSRAGAFVSDYLPGGRWATTTGALSDITAKQPDIAILDLGGNEYLNQIDPATFEANLRTLVANLKTARPDMDILLEVHETITWQSGTPKWNWQSYASRIANVAVSTPAALVDMRQYIPTQQASPQPKYTLWDADNIHVNDDGDMVIYGAMWGWLSAMASVC